MYTQSPSKSAVQDQLTIPVLAHSRILQRREVLSFSTNMNQGDFLKNQILNLVVNLDRKEIKVSFKELGETKKKGHQGKFFSRIFLLDIVD